MGIGALNAGGYPINRLFSSSRGATERTGGSSTLSGLFISENMTKPPIDVLTCFVVAERVTQLSKAKKATLWKNLVLSAEDFLASALGPGRNPRS